MGSTPVRALGLLLVATGCSVVAPSEDELGSEYGAGRWCDRQTATLCADFDDQLFPMGWEVKVREAATLSIDTTTFRSAPASLASVLMPSSTVAESRIRTNVPQSAQHTRISFDLHLAEPALAAGEDFTIVEFLCTDSTIYDGPWLQFAEPEGLVLTPILGSLVSADAFPFDRWVRVALDVRWGASGHTSVEVDGELVYDEDSSFECALPTFLLQVGLAAVGDVAGASAFYDNVLYELTDG
jgi:hypothetical protein